MMITRWFLFCSDIQDYIEFIIKKPKTLAAIPPIQVYIK